jgi:putative spermidine/putrescine transport system permease protein
MRVMSLMAFRAVGEQNDYPMASTIAVMMGIVVAVLIGVPAAYLLARRTYPFKKAVTLLFLLPVVMPPITYGIPLATVMYSFGLGRTLTAVILVNLVRSVPFVIMTMTPFIEQINPTIENAARMSGASIGKVLTKILFPLLIPGVLAASILVPVRTVGTFELTFLVSGPQSDTLVVAMYRARTDGSRRPSGTRAVSIRWVPWGIAPARA